MVGRRMCKIQFMHYKEGQRVGIVRRKVVDCIAPGPSLNTIPGSSSPSSAVRGSALLICRDLRILKPRFLHYILQGIFNNSTLLG
jgi:hypothetical protein